MSSDEVVAAKTFAKWLVVERLLAGVLTGKDLARHFGCRTAHVCSAEHGTCRRRRQLWPADDYLELYATLDPDLPSRLIRLRDRLREQPAGRTHYQYRAELERLHQPVAVAEGLIEKENLGSFMYPDRAEHDSQAVSGSNLVPLTLLAISLVPLLASGVLARQVDEIEPFSSVPVLTMWTLLIEGLALGVAAVAGAVLTRAADLLRRWTPLRYAICEIERLQVPTPFGRERVVSFLYLPPKDLTELYKLEKRIDLGTRTAALIALGTLASTAALAVHSSWALWWYPTILAVIALGLVWAAAFETRSMSLGVARNFARYLRQQQS